MFSHFTGVVLAPLFVVVDAVDVVMEQMVKTEKNRNYVLRFDMRARSHAFNTNDETVVVEWRGKGVGQYRASAPSTWTTHHIHVTGSGGQDRLVLREKRSGDGRGPFLDNISLRRSTELLINGSFESNSVPNNDFQVFDDSQVEGWTSLNGQPLELWGSMFQGVPATDGQTIFELDFSSGNAVDGIYQVRLDWCSWRRRNVPQVSCGWLLRLLETHITYISHATHFCGSLFVFCSEWIHTQHTHTMFTGSEHRSGRRLHAEV